jgi:hypothetical protein
VFGEGERATAKGAVIVHWAASGLRYRPLVPIWGSEAITLQPIRTGFPCFGAALAGYVEATVDGDDVKNRLCPPSPNSDTPADWARMQVLGNRASMSFASNPDIKAWADRVSLNPARIPRIWPAPPNYLLPWSASASTSGRGWPGWPNSLE